MANSQVRSEKHLMYVRSQPCMVCKTTIGVQAHHLMKPWQGGRGMGMKAGDQNCVPLCQTHHAALHAAGDEHHYFQVALNDNTAGAREAMRLWFSSPGYKERK